MISVKIAHFSDFHLGSDFSGMGRKANIRKNDIKETFVNIIRFCKEQNIQLVLIAGDLFESWNLSEDYYELVQTGLENLGETRVVIVAGNHDPLTPDSAFLRKGFWSDNVIIMPAEFSSILIDELGVEIWGASFSSTYQNHSLFVKVAPQNAEYIQLGIMHGMLGSDGQKTDYNDIFYSQIEKSGLDYLALGHIHKPSGVQKKGSTYYAYPGCPEGRGFDELGERGMLVGEVSKGKAELVPVRTAQRLYIEQKVNLSGINGSKSAADFILSELENNYSEGFRDNLYKIFLEGEADEIFSIETIKSYLTELFYVKLRDRTEPLIDLESVSKEVSLKGVFVRRMAEKLKSDASDLAKEALKLGLKAFSGEVEYIED